MKTGEEADPKGGEPLESKMVTKEQSHVGALFGWVLVLVRCVALAFICKEAIDIRLHAVKTYGRVIHEFDPWFNYRATEQLVRFQEQHGFFGGIHSFNNWYDDKVWSPLGRPVGTTIYPGMQITASVIHLIVNKTYPTVGPGIYETCKSMDKKFKLGIRKDICVPFKAGITLNDVCVFIPAYFGALASLFTFALCSEITSSPNTGVVAAAIMAIIPAHLMRSVGGGYDNESVAVTAICATFYFWVRSVRTSSSWPIGFVAGLAYTYMAAAWGGYVFVINMIGVHAGMLVVLGRYSSSLHHAYSAFFVLGTIGAMQVPIVGMAPLKSMEQAGPLLVFVGLQAIYAIDVGCRYMRISDRTLRWIAFYIYTAGALLLALVIQAVVSGEAAATYNALVDAGYVWDIGTRIKSLFVEHTKTGNPLVDSVAEHQSTPDSVYMQYMHSVYHAAKASSACSLSCYGVLLVYCCSCLVPPTPPTPPLTLPHCLPVSNLTGGLRHLLRPILHPAHQRQDISHLLLRPLWLLRAQDDPSRAPACPGGLLRCRYRLLVSRRLGRLPTQQTAYTQKLDPCCRAPAARSLCRHACVRRPLPTAAEVQAHAHVFALRYSQTRGEGRADSRELRGGQEH
jgi:hypothetical protein